MYPHFCSRIKTNETTSPLQNVSPTERLPYRTSPLPNVSLTERLPYRTSPLQNISPTEHLPYRTSPLQNVSPTERLPYRTSPLQNSHGAQTFGIISFHLDRIKKETLQANSDTSITFVWPAVLNATALLRRVSWKIGRRDFELVIHKT